ncbi:hypothetical protein, partial [Caproiciproducens galactitolivorans]|uniref:hypothetical protein n=1 Tax=Caproiciproducens galactitolivorans TaxID=642589 RepID=UPI002409FB1A
GMQATATKDSSKSWFSKTEGRLYAYPALMARHRDLAAELREAYPLGAQTVGDGTGIRAVGTHSDGAAKWAIRFEGMEKACDDSLLKVLKEFELVNGFLELCSEDEQEFVKLKYFKNLARSTVIRELAISLTTYYRLRDITVTRAAAIFGYLEYEEYIEMLAQ